MANENASVIDELIVRLRLDAEQYQRAEKDIDQNIDRTEKKQKERDVKRKRADQDQQKRWKSLTATAKSFTTQLGQLALIGGAVATAIGGTLTGLTGFELGLRRQAVSTGLSNRQMQAWGSTARRLGADADAGAQAVANLAKEQKQFRLTGQAPTLQALARAGVQVSPDMPIQDILANAQATYRRAGPAQQQQMEATLSAQGVSSDLILMIKSETDARAAYTKSLAEASTENRKALDGVADAMASLKANAISAANSLLILSSPYIKKFADWVGEAAQKTSEFNDKVTAAGGGVSGFLKVLDTDSPILGTALRTLAQTIDIVRFGLHELIGLLPNITGKGGWADRLNTKVATEAAKPHHAPIWGMLKQLGDWSDSIDRKLGIAPATGGIWGETVRNAHAAGYNVEAPTAPAAGYNVEAPTAPAPGVPRGTAVSAQDLMNNLITRHGLSVGEAAAVAANWQRESGLNPGDVTREGGGQGARGLAQWRGSRIDAFKARYGTTPDQATINQQIDFMLNDPYERAKLDESFRRGGSPAELGASYSRVYEAHGKTAEDARRGELAAQLAAQYRTANPNAPGGTAPISIQTVNVQANNPGEFVGSMQRIASPQNYNAAVR